MAVQLQADLVLNYTYFFSLRTIQTYTTFTNLSTKYLVMCKVYTGVGGI